MAVQLKDMKDRERYVANCGQRTIPAFGKTVPGPISFRALLAGVSPSPRTGSRRAVMKVFKGLGWPRPTDSGQVVIGVQSLDWTFPTDLGQAVMKGPI